MQLVNEYIHNPVLFSGYPMSWVHANYRPSVIYKLFRGRHDDDMHANADTKLFQIY